MLIQITQDQAKYEMARYFQDYKTYIDELAQSIFKRTIEPWLQLNRFTLKQTQSGWCLIDQSGAPIDVSGFFGTEDQPIIDYLYMNVPGLPDHTLGDFMEDPQS